MFTIGYNTPGYLCEMEPLEAGCVQDAIEYMQGEMEAHAEFAVDGAQMPLAAALEEAMDAVKAWDGLGTFSFIVHDPERIHDLGTCYWILQTVDEPTYKSEKEGQGTC